MKFSTSSVISIKAKIGSNAVPGGTVSVNIENGNNTGPALGGQTVVLAQDINLQNVLDVATKESILKKGITYEVAPAFNSQESQNGLSSFAKAVVIGQVPSGLGNASLLDQLIGGSSSTSGYQSPEISFEVPEQDDLSQTDTISVASIAISDPDSKNKYAILQSQGLNVLRSEIISVMEYIPIAKPSDYYGSADNNSEYEEAGIKKVSKIIELHRQIREYLLMATSKVFASTFEYYNFINDPVKFLQNNQSQLGLPDNVVNSIANSFSLQNPNGILFTIMYSEIKNKMISIIGNIQNTSGTYWNTINNLYNSALFENATSSNINDTIVDIIYNSIRNSPGSSPVYDMFTNLKDVGFIKSLIEFFIYRYYIEILIESYSNLDIFSKNIIAAWKIDISGNTPINNPNEYFGDATGLGLKSLLISNSVSDLYENYLGIVKTPECSDTDLLYQTLISINSQMSLKDSAHTLNTANELSLEEKQINGSVFRTSVKGDLSEAFKRLRKFKIHSLISEIGTSSVRGKLKLGSIDTSDTVLSPGNWNQIGSEIEISGPSSWQRSSEMLAAYAFDFCINLNSTRRIGFSSNHENFPFSSFGSLTHEDYRKKVLLGEFSDEFFFNGSEEKIISADEFYSKQTKEPLLLGGSYISTFSDAGINLFESGESSKNNNLPGAEYVYENISLAGSLETSLNKTGLVDQNIKNNVDTVFNHYAEASKSFFSDLGSIFIDYYDAKNSNGTIDRNHPIGKMSPKHRIKNLLTYLAEDIDRIITQPNQYIPLLATFLSQTPSNPTVQLKTFLAMFWGYIDSSEYRKILNLNEEDTDESKRKIMSDLIGSLNHYYNEQISRNFLVNKLKFNNLRGLQANLSNANEEEIERLGYYGGKYAYDNQIDGFNSRFNTYLGSIESTQQIDIRNKVYFPSVVGEASSEYSLLPNSVYLGDKNSVIPSYRNSMIGSSEGDDIVNTFYNKDLSDSNSVQAAGIFKLFKKSFGAICSDLDFSDFLGESFNYPDSGVITNVEETIRMFDLENGFGGKPSWSNDGPGYKSSLGPLGLKMHHKAILWYKWIYGLLAKNYPGSIKMKTSTVEAEQWTNDKGLIINYSKDQLEGLRDGLIAAANRVGNLESLVEYSNNLVESDFVGPPTAGEIMYKNAKKATVEKIIPLVTAIDDRYEKIATTASILINHSHEIKKSYNQSFLNVSPVTLLALSPLLESTLVSGIPPENDMNVVKKWTSAGQTIVNKYSMASMIKSMNRYFGLPSDHKFLVNNSLTTNVNKIKLMYKILSQSGYGFLDEEKKGLKSIISVGIPAGMIETLQKNAYQETGNEAYLDSSYVCIIVNKNNHLSENDFYDPKIFVFDAGANILDFNYLASGLGAHVDADHLINYSDEESLDTTLSNIKITRFSDFTFGNPVQLSGTFSSIAAKNDNQTDFNSIDGKSILMNHAIDYALKLYMYLTTGIIMDEETFSFSLGQVDTGSLNSENLDSKKERLFQHILNTLSTTYPQVNEDEQLRNEVFRLTNIIKQMTPFSNKINYMKTMLPRKFDKVYSIIVNEKDFTLKGDPDIFESPTNRNIGSKIEIVSNKVDSDKLDLYLAAGVLDIPSIDSSGQTSNASGGLNSALESLLGDIFVNRDDNLSTQVLSYVKSLNENAPEVYNYSVNIALLPSDKFK